MNQFIVMPGALRLLPRSVILSCAPLRASKDDGR
jgi:hypothetical protein